MERTVVMFSAMSVLSHKKVRFAASGIKDFINDAIEHAEVTGEDTHIVVFSDDGSEVELQLTLKPGKCYKSPNQP